MESPTGVNHAHDGDADGDDEEYQLRKVLLRIALIAVSAIGATVSIVWLIIHFTRG